MAITHHTFTLTGSAQALSTISGATTRPLRTVTIQPSAANAAEVYIGAAGVTTTDFGIRLEAADGEGRPSAPLILADTQGQVGHFKLSDVYVIGQNLDKIHVLVVSIDG